MITWLNILWLLFSLFGLILVGVAPATVASLGVTRKMVAKKRGKNDLWTVQTNL